MDKQEEKIMQALKEIIPHNGLVYSEHGLSTEILCKPKILPLKSLTLQKLEQMEKEMLALAKN